MKNFLKLFFISVILLITGCSSVVEHKTSKPVVISRSTYVFVPIPENLMVDCKIDSPPSVKDYLTADWSNKEAMFSVYIKSLITNLNTCNTKFYNLRKWNQSQKGIYETKPKE